MAVNCQVFETMHDLLLTAPMKEMEISLSLSD